MAGPPRRAIRPGLYQDRQGIRRHSEGQYCSFFGSYFGLVRKAADGVHLFRRDWAGTARVARRNRRVDESNKRRVETDTATNRRLSKPKPATAHQGKPKT